MYRELHARSLGIYYCQGRHIHTKLSNPVHYILNLLINVCMILLDSLLKCFLFIAVIDLLHFIVPLFQSAIYY
jgi:hypothetical protein